VFLSILVIFHKRMIVTEITALFPVMSVHQTGSQTTAQLGVKYIVQAEENMSLIFMLSSIYQFFHESPDTPFCGLSICSVT